LDGAIDALESSGADQGIDQAADEIESDYGHVIIDASWSRLHARVTSVLDARLQK
jgi:hypothetical protein